MWASVYLFTYLISNFLCFVVDDNKFVSLPFSLSSAPRVFIKILASLLVLLTTQGIQATGYLDDLLLNDASPSQLLVNVQKTIHLLQALEYLGLILDMSQAQKIKFFLSRS